MFCAFADKCAKVRDSNQVRSIHNRHGLRYKIIGLFDQASCWVAAALIGVLTACVAFLVDVAEATVSDWKYGYCRRNPLLNREACCATKRPMDALSRQPALDDNCPQFLTWADSYAPAFAIYVAWALLFGIISCSLTMLTKRSLPVAELTSNDDSPNDEPPQECQASKTMYMAAGSGIPEIKTILSGFVIPDFLDFKVLFVKALGAVFAVATGMCLGKEGPFVHISTCVGYLVARYIPKYRDNGRKMREMLSAACASGLSVAFAAPIGGVLFSYEVRRQRAQAPSWTSALCKALFQDPG